MSNANKEQTADGTISCHLCHQEVPHANALTVEAQEYLYFFCGQGCYSRWQARDGLDRPRKGRES